MSLHFRKQLLKALRYRRHLILQREHFILQRLHLTLRILSNRTSGRKIRVPFVRSQDNIADLFTKPSEAHLFFPLRDTIMNVPLSMRDGARHVTTGGRCEERSDSLEDGSDSLEPSTVSK